MNIDMGFFDKLFGKSKPPEENITPSRVTLWDTLFTDSVEPSESAKDIIELLGLEYKIIPEGSTEGDIIKLFNHEVVNAYDLNWAYRPVYIIPSDTLYETLLMNLNNEENEINRDTINNYIKNAMATSPLDGEGYFNERFDNDPELKSLELGEVDDDVFGMRDYISIFTDELSEDDDRLTKELILLRVPVSNPWEIFAYLPFGGWNECPDTEVLMAVSKYWHEKHGATPSVIGSDTLEFIAPIVRDKEKADLLAKEMYLLCPDIVDQGVGSVDILSEILTDSDCWYFWWD